jgi:hypothetical protein
MEESTERDRSRAALRLAVQQNRAETLKALRQAEELYVVNEAARESLKLIIDQRRPKRGKR